MSKKCTKCREVKLLTEFNTKKGAGDGRRSECKKCHSVYMKTKNFPRKTSGNKYCRRCKKTKDVSEYGNDKMRPDGLQSWCKKCKKNYRDSRKNKIHNVDEKKCKICNKIKSLTEFHINASGIYGYHNECKVCRCIKRKGINVKKPTCGCHICSMCKKNKAVSKYHADKSSNTGMQSCCIKCEKIKMNKWACNLNGFIVKLHKNVRSNAKRRAKKLKVEITKQDIHDLYKKQNGICVISGIKMTHKAYTRTVEKRHIMNDNNISVDRIDSNKGYTKDNIQLVCAVVNRMKSDMSDYKFKTMCQIITAYGMIKYLEKL